MHNGLTLIELTVIISIMLILLVIGLPTFYSFQQNSSLINLAENIKSTLYLAQNKTLAHEANQTYGVFFDDNFPQKYVLFGGSAYASRNASLDQTHSLSPTTEFSQIDFGGTKEAKFKLVTGEAEIAGFVTVRLKSQPLITKTIYLDSFGTITLATSTLPDESSRIKDSRHTHIVYTRAINTATSTSESIVLNWSSNLGSVIQAVKISDYLQAGNFVWSGIQNVDGEKQQIEIRTHWLNNPDTQFSIIRDRRYNTKPLQISLDGDALGDLIVYSANGSTTAGTSIYAQQPIWQ